MDYDYEKLREDLIDYFEGAVFSGYSVAIMDIIDVEGATNAKLLQYAKEAGFRLERYRL